MYNEKTYIKKIYIYIHLYTHNQSLVLDTKHVLYWPVTQHKAGLGAGTKPVLERLVYQRR